MAELLDSARRKLARAKLHIDDLKGRISAFEQSHSYESICEPDPDKPDELLHKIKCNRPIPETSEIAGDAINNLREALDHAAYAVALPPRKHCAFPFGSPEEFARKKSRGHSKDLPEEFFSLFRAFKPYEGGNNLLWALNRICIANKHTFLTTITLNATRVTEPFTVTYSREAEPFWITFPRDIVWDRTKQEVVVARSSTRADAQFQCRVTTFISFDDIEIVRNQEVVAVLDALVGVVDQILRDTETLARQLGVSSDSYPL